MVKCAPSRKEEEFDVTKTEAIKLAEISAGEKKFVTVADVIKTLIKYSVSGFLGWCFFSLFGEGLKSPPESISALADFCRQFHTADIFFGITALGGCGWGLVERHRNKRLVKENGELRRKVEAGDAYKSRSNLDKYGNAEGE